MLSTDSKTKEKKKKQKKNSLRHSFSATYHMARVKDTNPKKRKGAKLFAGKKATQKATLSRTSGVSSKYAPQTAKKRATSKVYFDVKVEHCYIQNVLCTLLHYKIKMPCVVALLIYCAG